MSEYVFRYASGYGCDMSGLMDGGRVTVGEYFASESTDHYGTLHEEIVRCRDCRHYIDGECMKPDGNGDYLRLIVPRAHFCGFGERRA